MEPIDETKQTKFDKPSFSATLKRHFPQAVLQRNLIPTIFERLDRLGFTSDCTIAVVCLCREDTTKPLRERIRNSYDVFDISSSSGFLICGKSGFAAAHDHAPTVDGRQRVVYFAMPHIAIDSSGEMGCVLSPGRRKKSVACSSLTNIIHEMNSGHVSIDFDTSDLEQFAIKRRLFEKLEYGKKVDLVELTMLASEIIVEDLNALISSTVDLSCTDYVVVTGVQIHGPEGNDFLWARDCYSMVNGIRTSLLS